MNKSYFDDCKTNIDGFYIFLNLNIKFAKKLKIKIKTN